jgi:hypothetical protein
MNHYCIHAFMVAGGGPQVATHHKKAHSLAAHGHHIPRPTVTKIELYKGKYIATY